MLATPVAFPIRSHTCTTYSECISVMTHNNEDTSTSKSTRLHERKDTNWKYDVTRSSYLMLTTSVAHSDSFTNCHECRSYLDSITNDDRQIIVRMFFHMMFRYCTSDHWLGQHPMQSVVYTCKHITAKACIHASTQLRMQETIEKFLIRFWILCFRIAALYIRWCRAWVRPWSR